MLSMLRGLGLTVVEVEGLSTLATLVTSVDVLLIRRGACESDLAAVADQLLLDRVPEQRRGPS